MPETSPAEKNWGGLGIGVLAVVLVAIGAYAWYTSSRDDGAESISQESIQEIQTQDTSSDPSSIEADLGAQSPDDFNAEIDAAFKGTEDAYAE